MSLFVVFFFKQKTAYEMRISDWSSDVCSSDLKHSVKDSATSFQLARQHVSWPRLAAGQSEGFAMRMRLLCLMVVSGLTAPACHAQSPQGQRATRAPADVETSMDAPSQPETRSGPRSEEHTSELQSLMRISYAVFCLKKKKKKN